MPVAADPIDWANWSGVVTSPTSTGSALATFADLGITDELYLVAAELRAGLSELRADSDLQRRHRVEPAGRPPTGSYQTSAAPTPELSTITFSQAVLNPVLAIWSLGQPGLLAQYVFGQSFTIQSGGPNAEYGGADDHRGGQYGVRERRQRRDPVQRQLDVDHAGPTPSSKTGTGSRSVPRSSSPFPSRKPMPSCSPVWRCSAPARAAVATPAEASGHRAAGRSAALR